jgi:hypothetical protein
LRTTSPPPQSQSGTSALPQGAAPAVKPQNSWLSADDEKRLYQQAQEATKRTQLGPQLVLQAARLTHSRSNSDPESQSSSGSGSKLSGADMYAQAINAQNRKQAQAGGSVASSPAKPSVTQYPTAEQEKAELKRYQEAKRTGDKMQSTIGDLPPPALTAPVAYESLFPETTRGAPAASSSHSPPLADAPPPFESAVGGSNSMVHLSEKERLRRKYEAQNAAALTRQNANAAPPPAASSSPAPAPVSTPPPVLVGLLPGQYVNASEEKEALRKKFEERDRAMKANITLPHMMATRTTLSLITLIMVVRLHGIPCRHQSHPIIPV